MSALVTRRPTGQPAWPILLLAGAEKAGKSWACAVASGSPLIGRTLWIGVGEDDPDEYGSIPGANFEIVEHDGTYRGILGAITAAVGEPLTDGRPTLLVVDSMTRVWNLLSDDAQATANARARRKAESNNREASADDAQISIDLWNTAKQRWVHILDALRAHRGPVLLTARLEQVTVMDDKGQPTTEKTLKVQGEKNLPYDVGGVVEMPEAGKAVVRGLRSARLRMVARTDWPEFTVHDLWTRMGLDAGNAVGERHHAGLAVRADDDLSPGDSPPSNAELALSNALAGVAVSTTPEQVRAVWSKHARSLDTAGKAKLETASRARIAEIVPVTQTPADDEPPVDSPADVPDSGMVDAAPPPAAGDGSARPASRGQLTAVSKAFGALGVTDRPTVLAVCSAIAERRLSSRNELTTGEAADIEATLAELINAGSAAAEVTAFVEMCQSKATTLAGAA